MILECQELVDGACSTLLCFSVSIRWRHSWGSQIHEVSLCLWTTALRAMQLS